MRILFLTTAHNGLSQRAQAELTERGHDVTVELALSEQHMIDAVDLAAPELIIAPMLKKAIPEIVWRHHTCLIVHPGIVGDRGPSSLDWAITDGVSTWGVTVLEAVAEMDAGDIWSTREFAMPQSSKGSVYRNEVTTAAMRAIHDAVERFEQGSIKPRALDYSDPNVLGRLRPTMKQADRAIDWTNDSTAIVARKLRAADSAPGVLDRIGERDVYVYGVHEEDDLRGKPGEIIAKRDGAICRATIDGAVWLTHLKEHGRQSLKLPAAHVLGAQLDHVPEVPIAIDDNRARRTYRELRYEESGAIGWLHFDFYNGAMSTEQCQRLRDALVIAKARPTNVLVLLGGADFFSNGIHLNTIEAAPDAAEESWRNINAIDDVVLEILHCEKLVVSALQGNAGAGGAMMALAADLVFARDGVVLNPHYRTMGLFGSEYWTYTLPRRLGPELAHALTESCLAVGTRHAQRIGLLDDAFGDDVVSFLAELRDRLQGIVAAGDVEARIARKIDARRRDERLRPLASYRDAELAQMRACFADPAYAEARRRFVYKIAPERTPPHVALHRGPAWRRSAPAHASEKGPSQELAALTSS